MTNPVLRKLRSGRLTKSAIADLLQKHIGDGSNESHCVAACGALRTIRDEDSKDLAELIRIFQGSNGLSACDTIKQVIAALRGPNRL